MRFPFKRIPAYSRLCEKCLQPFRTPECPDSRDKFEHHALWQDLQRAAQNGCYVCSWWAEDHIVARGRRMDPLTRINLKVTIDMDFKKLMVETDRDVCDEFVEETFNLRATVGNCYPHLFFVHN